MSGAGLAHREVEAPVLIWIQAARSTTGASASYDPRSWSRTTALSSSPSITGSQRSAPDPAPFLPTSRATLTGSPISNSRLIAIDQADVTFKWKDYCIKGRDRLRTMTLDATEFIRRFLLHVPPSGFHRIRHYGLFAGTVRARNIERVRQWLAAPEASPAETDCDFE